MATTWRSSTGLSAILTSSTKHSGGIIVQLIPSFFANPILDFPRLRDEHLVRVKQFVAQLLEPELMCLEGDLAQLEGSDDGGLQDLSVNDSGQRASYGYDAQFLTQKIAIRIWLGIAAEAIGLQIKRHQENIWI